MGKTQLTVLKGLGAQQWARLYFVQATHKHVTEETKPYNNFSLIPLTCEITTANAKLKTCAPKGLNLFFLHVFLWAMRTLSSS